VEILKVFSHVTKDLKFLIVVIIFCVRDRREEGKVCCYVLLINFTNEENECKLVLLELF
jgi:hypothetical protein